MTRASDCNQKIYNIKNWDEKKMLQIKRYPITNDSKLRIQFRIRKKLNFFSETVETTSPKISEFIANNND